MSWCSGQDYRPYCPTLTPLLLLLAFRSQAPDYYRHVDNGADTADSQSKVGKVTPRSAVLWSTKRAVTQSPFYLRQAHGTSETTKLDRDDAAFDWLPLNHTG